MCQRPKFISENPNDLLRFAVESGELGDQWLLAAVASLALTPRFLDRVVPPDQGFDNTSGYCGVFRYVPAEYFLFPNVILDLLKNISKESVIYEFNILRISPEMIPESINSFHLFSFPRERGGAQIVQCIGILSSHCESNKYNDSALIFHRLMAGPMNKSIIAIPCDAAAAIFRLLRRAQWRYRVNNSERLIYPVIRTKPSHKYHCLLYGVLLHHYCVMHTNNSLARHVLTPCVKITDAQCVSWKVSVYGDR